MGWRATGRNQAAFNGLSSTNVNPELPNRPGKAPNHRYSRAMLVVARDLFHSARCRCLQERGHAFSRGDALRYYPVKAVGGHP
jgi:hypothetical protein